MSCLPVIFDVFLRISLYVLIEQNAQLLAAHGRSHWQNKIGTPSRGKYEPF